MAELDPAVEACPHCGERVTGFQRTYGGRLIDGKYQILQRLGVGGMGEIFKVRHIHLGEERVIKIMRANIATDEQSLQRFFQEARMATMIKHRNLAMLYDFSTLDDGSYYMVWEYIEGINIQKWINQNGPVPPRLAVEIAIQALQGLGSLHQMGIIHRDISPENIMLSQDFQGKLLIKVIDFGIAKQLEGEGGGGGGQGLTQTGMFLGKLKYASPEQAGFLKEGETLDARTDLYSFGVVFYEMLAGKAPFIATNPHGYILKHATEKPAPIGQTNPDVKIPPALEALVLKILEKDRDNRFADADEFVAALEDIRNDIAPDSKFGVGERMMTLSSRNTMMDPTRPGTRMGGTRVGKTIGTPAGGTRTGASDATVVERHPTAAGAQATVVETAAGAAPTVMEPGLRPVTAAGGEATVLEPRAPAASPAEPTVIERKFESAPAKSKTPMLVAIAAVVVIALIGVGVIMLRKPAPAVQPVSPATPQSTVVVQPSTALDLPPDKALILLKSPIGEISRIENADTNKEVPFAKASMPARIWLPPGNYVLTISDDNGNPQKVQVKLGPSDVREISPKWDKVNIDKAVEDILKK
ncbi:MAG: protein kinase [Thermoanaerobaculia bacterium]